MDLTEREVSAVVASLNEGGADADAELVDGQRFLKRMNMLNSSSTITKSRENTSGRRLDPERALQRARSPQIDIRTKTYFRRSASSRSSRRSTRAAWIGKL